MLGPERLTGLGSTKIFTMRNQNFTSHLTTHTVNSGEMSSYPLTKIEGCSLKTLKNSNSLHTQRGGVQELGHTGNRGDSISYHSDSRAPIFTSSASQTQCPEHSQPSTTSRPCPDTTGGIYESDHPKSGQARTLLASGCRDNFHQVSHRKPHGEVISWPTLFLVSHSL